ncbi:MAG TPA: STAS domain-containing protein [Mycobacterium sp.]|nr:STAS domain-containing protein [Mycobacterium sp.]HTQ17261.1 STAS domain-containing protein [Mycobacterium sp.]
MGEDTTSGFPSVVPGGEAAVPESSPAIWIDIERHRDVPILVMHGALDSDTYRQVRDTIIKAALDEPRAVIVDVNDLSVPSASAWSVFTSARWHVSIWPDVPILLVCANLQRRLTIAGGGVARYVPVHATRAAVLQTVAAQASHGRRRARAQLPASEVSIGLSRNLIADWLTAWGQPRLIPIASTVATVFIGNVLAYTESAPVLTVENYEETITVAVGDDSQVPASLHEDADHGIEILSGLALVSALCRSWGSAPTSSGKTLWAVIGRENQL